jgi:hypothetical protein
MQAAVEVELTLVRVLLEVLVEAALADPKVELAVQMGQLILAAVAADLEVKTLLEMAAQAVQVSLS